VLQRAQANLAAVQYETLVAPHWGKLQWGGGSPEAFEAVLKGLGEWTADYLPDFMISGKEFGVGDIKLGPFVVSPRCERQPGDERPILCLVDSIAIVLPARHWELAGGYRPQDERAAPGRPIRKSSQVRQTSRRVVRVEKYGRRG
jgi:hypothetical protein